MTDAYTTGVWVAEPGHEADFVEAWKEFATWAASRPGAGTLRLTQDLADRSRFVSFGRWDSIDDAHTWKSDPGFGPRMAQVQKHVARFEPAELEELVAVAPPAS
ncbi:MAG: antibiotic biosynthesis monooxygenase family protein [Actinomycetes bacterium]